MSSRTTTVIVVYPGVLADEAEVFRFVLSRLPEFEAVTAGTARGWVTGVGGVQTADAALDEISDPEIVAVPGGIGSDHRVEIASWLKRVSPTWMLASSTGTVLLAAAGLLHNATAATHWLAGPLLERYGAHPAGERVVVDGPIITCSGSLSAFRGGLVVAEAYGGPELVARIRADASERAATPPTRSLWARVIDTVLRRHPESSVRPPLAGTSDEIEVLDLGLITPPDRRPRP